MGAWGCPTAAPEGDMEIETSKPKPQKEKFPSPSWGQSLRCESEEMGRDLIGRKQVEKAEEAAERKVTQPWA